MKARAAVERLARAERGEDVGPVPPPITRADWLRALRWTKSDAAHAERLAEINLDSPEWKELLAEIARGTRAAEKAASRAVLRRRKAGPL